MKRILSVLMAVVLMVAMVGAYALPAVAQQQDPSFIPPFNPKELEKRLTACGSDIAVSKILGAIKVLKGLPIIHKVDLGQVVGGGTAILYLSKRDLEKALETGVGVLITIPGFSGCVIEPLAHPEQLAPGTPAKPLNHPYYGQKSPTTPLQTTTNTTRQYSNPGTQPTTNTTTRQITQPGTTTNTTSQQIVQPRPKRNQTSTLPPTTNSTNQYSNPDTQGMKPTAK